MWECLKDMWCLLLSSHMFICGFFSLSFTHYNCHTALVEFALISFWYESLLSAYCSSYICCWSSMKNLSGDYQQLVVREHLLYSDNLSMSRSNNSEKRNLSFTTLSPYNVNVQCDYFKVNGCLNISQMENPSGKSICLWVLMVW